MMYLRFMRLNGNDFYRIFLSIDRSVTTFFSASSGIVITGFSKQASRVFPGVISSDIDHTTNGIGESADPFEVIIIPRGFEFCVLGFEGISQGFLQ